MLSNESITLYCIWPVRHRLHIAYIVDVTTRDSCLVISYFVEHNSAVTGALDSTVYSGSHPGLLIQPYGGHSLFFFQILPSLNMLRIQAGKQENLKIFVYLGCNMSEQ